jgi:hypothetical protein
MVARLTINFINDPRYLIRYALKSVLVNPGLKWPFNLSIGKASSWINV